MAQAFFPLFADIGRAGGEQHLALEDEAVADNANIAAVGQHFAQAAEKLRAEARQFLDFSGQGGVQALTKIDDFDLLRLVFRLGGLKGRLDTSELLAQLDDLQVQQGDLGQRLLGGFLGGGQLPLGFRQGLDAQIVLRG